MYPNGDSFEGTFNEKLEKHGRGVYTWGTAVGNNPWVPEEGFPGAWLPRRRARRPPPPRARPPIPLTPPSPAPAEGKAPTVSYDGMYTEGKKHGIGKLQLPNGDKYQGSFSADRFEGEGSYFFANGDVYSGAWKAGERSGEGTLMYAKDESQLVGTWVKGAMVTGKWMWRDGSSWHGPFKNSLPLGKGVFYFPNGMVQEGEYVLRGEGGEGEEEGESLKTVWVGKPARPANTSAAEVTRA